MEILYAGLIIFVAYFVRSVCGFGGSLVSLPVLILFMDLPDIVALMTLLTLATSMIVVTKSIKKADKKTVFALMIGSAPATLLGVYLLNSLEPIILLRILGVVLILFAWNFVREESIFRFKPNKVNGTIAGFISGLMGGMFSTSGPPAVAYMTVVFRNAKKIRASLLLYFLLLNLVKTGGLLFASNIQKENLLLFLYMVPPMLIASELGHHAHLKIPEKGLKYSIALLMVVSGVSLIFK